VPGEIDMAGQNHVQAMAGFADPKQRFARAIAADFAKSTDPLDLRRLKAEEYLVASRIGDEFGQVRYAHGQQVTRPTPQFKTGNPIVEVDKMSVICTADRQTGRRPWQR